VGDSLESREELMKIVSSSAALLHCWPTAYFHPIEAMGRPVVKTLGLSREQLLRAARDAIAGKRSVEAKVVAPLSAEMIGSLLGCNPMRKF
jgi:hypothetical protein